MCKTEWETDAQNTKMILYLMLFKYTSTVGEYMVYPCGTFEPIRRKMIEPNYFRITNRFFIYRLRHW